MAINFFDLRAPQKVIIVLHPHDLLYTCGISRFGFGLGVLSNMISAFDADFECPAHITGTLDFEYPPRSPLRDFSSMLSKKPVVEMLCSCFASASVWVASSHWYLVCVRQFLSCNQFQGKTEL